MSKRNNNTISTHKKVPKCLIIVHIMAGTIYAQWEGVMNEKPSQSNSSLSSANIIEHLRYSLANVQEAIRFIDAKVAGALAFASVILGFTVSKTILASQLRECKFPCSQWWFLWGLLVLLALTFIAVVVFAALTQFPRQSKKITNRLWLLFPLEPNELKGIYFRDELARIIEGISENVVISEFCDQLAINSSILTTKLKWCRWLFRATIAFIVAAFALGATSLLIFVNT